MSNIKGIIMKSETDVVKVLKEDGITNIDWSALRKYENKSTVSLTELRNELGMGSWAVRIAYNELFGGVIIQQQSGEGNRKHYHPDADENWVILDEALTSSKITHYGRPEERREYINVVDAANLTVKMLDENYKNDNYILTGNQSITKADLYSMISEILDKSIDVKYKKPVPTKDSSHYTITPYTYLPKPGKKITPELSIDLGQGLIQLIEEIKNKSS